jgi:leucyl aminopeptidase
VASVPGSGDVPFGSVVFVGLGADLGAEELRRAAGSAGVATMRCRRVVTTLHQAGGEGGVEAVALGFLLGQYRFDELRSEKKPSLTESLHFAGASDLAGAERARVVADAVMLARDLVNTPAGDKPPVRMAEIAAEIAERTGMSLTAYGLEECIAEGFGGLLGVNAGSVQPPRMVVLRHEPESPRAFLALVGKGIVFDSGGLSLKPAQAMETMKTDMSGAAAVFGAMQAIATLQLPVKVVGIAPITENMPSGSATRPGDVLRARNGKTIEVMNTDAEGRLVLADGLSLAAEEEPDLIVDLATLTGACMVALGEKIAGLFGTGDAPDRVREAAEAAGERVWPMPMPADYRKLIDSDVADMKNSGPRYGGAINAALLLKEFVGEVPWAHLDIAGPARSTDAEHYVQKGGTGFGVRTVVELAERLSAAG